MIDAYFVWREREELKERIFIQIDLVQSSGVLLGRYFKFCPPTQLAWKPWQAFLLIRLLEIILLWLGIATRQV